MASDLNPDLEFVESECIELCANDLRRERLLVRLGRVRDALNRAMADASRLRNLRKRVEDGATLSMRLGDPANSVALEALLGSAGGEHGE